MRPLAVNVGVIITVAVSGVVLLLIAAKAGIVPDPLAGRPIVELLFVQVYTVPGTAPAGVTAVVAVPLQTVWFAIAFTFGVGFTVIVKLADGPVQVTPALVKLPVTVTVAVTGAVPVLVAVNAGVLVVPAVPRPILGVLFVQVYTAPLTGPLKKIAGIGVPLHTIMF